MRRFTSPRAVLFIDHGQSIGGSGVSLVAVLATIGMRVRRVLAIPPGPTRSAVETQHGADDYVSIAPIVGDGTRRALVLARSALRILVETRTEPLVAVHANGLLDLMLATPTAALRRLPVVVWLHDAEVTTRDIVRALPIMRRLLPRIIWAAVSDAAADSAVQAGLAHRNDIVVVPNPVVSGGNVTPRDDAVVRVGFLGTDTERKGFDLLPEIARSLDPATRRLLLFSKRHVGLDDDTVRAWSELEGSPAVEIRGRVDDVSGAYAECDVVICPSRSESFCRVAAEALAHGVPVVASDLPAIREVLDDGHAGVLVPSGDAPAFVEAVDRLAADSDARARLSAAGRARAAAFQPAEVADRLLDLYLSAS